MAGLLSTRGAACSRFLERAWNERGTVWFVLSCDHFGAGTGRGGR